MVLDQRFLPELDGLVQKSINTGVGQTLEQFVLNGVSADETVDHSTAFGGKVTSSAQRTAYGPFAP